MRTRLNAIIAGLILGLGTGCAKPIIVPRSDPTPPSISLRVWGLGGEFELVPGGAPVARTATADAEIVLIATGTDKNGGVKNVRIEGAATVLCEGGPGLSLHLASQNPEAPDVGVGGQARDQRATNLLLKVAEMRSRCAAPATFRSLSAGFTASAENFHGGTATTPAVSISHP